LLLNTQLSSVGSVVSRFNQVRLSVDGRWAVMSVFDQNHGTLDLWTMEISTGAARRVSTLPANTVSPVFSPDATRIVYGKAYGRSPMLAMLSLQEGVVAQDLPEGVPEGDIQIPTDWSPDGRFIAEHSFPRTHSSSRQNADVYLVDLARKSELVPLLVGAMGAVFAPDGRSIAFIDGEAYVQAFDAEARRLTGTRHQISRGGAGFVRWPKPGRETLLSRRGSLDLFGDFDRSTETPVRSSAGDFRVLRRCFGWRALLVFGLSGRPAVVLGGPVELGESGWLELFGYSGNPVILIDIWMRATFWKVTKTLRQIFVMLNHETTRL
jgi:Tol biopolymer transport system component